MKQVFTSSKAQRMKASEYSLSEWEKGDFATAEGKMQSTTALQCLETGDNKGGMEEKYMDKSPNLMAWMPCKEVCQTVPASVMGKL